MKLAALSLSAVLLASTAYAGNGPTNVDIDFPLVAGGALYQVTPSNPLPVNPGALSFGSPQALVTSANPLPVEPGPVTYQSGAVAVPVSSTTPLPVVDASQSMGGVGIDGSTTVSGSGAVTLFGGVVPAHGWMVMVTGIYCGGQIPANITGVVAVSDSNVTPASSGTGIPLSALFSGPDTRYVTSLSNVFITPPGYKAPGPVTVANTWCGGAQTSIYARAW